MANEKKKRPCTTPGCKANAFAAVTVCAKCFAVAPMEKRGTPMPSNVDIRTFPDMPLNVRAVRDSDTLAAVSDEGFKAAFQLWCAAWHQIPASSIPDDDATLARLAGYGRDVKKWKKIKNEALRGFLICSDGRLYHLYMADKAWKAWLKSDAGRNSANQRWENEQPTGIPQFQGMPTHSEPTSERTTNADANPHATADADALRPHMQSQCSEQNRVEIDKNPPAAPESETAREARKPPADAAARVSRDRVKPITEQIWVMANKTQEMDRWRAGAKTDDFRAVIAWIALGWTEPDILEAAQSVIGSAGEIRSLWGLLAKAMPDAVDRIRNGTNATRTTPGVELNTPEQREFNRDVARYLGWLTTDIWLPSYGDVEAVSQLVRDEANRRLLGKGEGMMGLNAEQFGPLRARDYLGTISMKRDYVIETTDGSVATMKIAVQELTKAGFVATWLAADETYTDRKRQTRTLKVSVFPGYLFVEFDAGDVTWRQICSLRGVKRVQRVLGGNPTRPVALPVGAVDRLRAQFQAGEFKLKPLVGIAKGDRVVFEAGPFAGHVGKVSQSNGERIRVLMDLFGAEREVPVNSGMVRRAAE